MEGNLKDLEVACNNLEIAGVRDLLAFWTGLMYDSDGSLVQRLKASELLARAYGMFREYVNPSTIPSAYDKAIERAAESLSTEELMKLVYGEEK